MEESTYVWCCSYWWKTLLVRGIIMTDINETMGEIKTHIVHIREKVDVMDDKVNNLNNESIKQRIHIDAAHKRIDELQPIIESHEKIKNKGLGIFAFLGFIAGSIGVGITKILGIFH